MISNGANMNTTSDSVDVESHIRYHHEVVPADWSASEKRVVVIGSSATAVTLVPELSKETASITMLQRSPTYIASVPERDAMAETLRRWPPDSLIFRLTRWKQMLRSGCTSVTQSQRRGR
jgi:monooxygenase